LKLRGVGSTPVPTVPWVQMLISETKGLTVCFTAPPLHGILSHHRVQLNSAHLSCKFPLESISLEQNMPRTL